MRRARLLLLVGVAALIFGVLPSAADGPDWGTWTIGGHATTWGGAFVDSHHVTGFVIGLRSLKKYNSITSFTIGGQKCNLGSIGTGYCYSVDIPANTKLKWKITARKRVNFSRLISPCIKYSGDWHCRYGNG